MSRPWTLAIKNPATMMMHIIASEFSGIITPFRSAQDTKKLSYINFS
jgi:hypothetical protein